MTTNTSNTTSGGSNAFSSLGAQDYNYNTPAIQVGNQVRDGDRFVLIVQSKQSDTPKIWSSGDKDETAQLVRQTTNAMQPQTA